MGMLQATSCATHTAIRMHNGIAAYKMAVVLLVFHAIPFALPS